LVLEPSGSKRGVYSNDWTDQVNRKLHKSLNILRLNRSFDFDYA